MNSDLITSVLNTLNIDANGLGTTEHGSNNRTFTVVYNGVESIIRFEEKNGFQLKRAYSAQLAAQKMGVKVPHIIAHNFDLDEQCLWILEEKLDGVHFHPDEMKICDAQQISTELGKQFKLVNSVNVDRFGLTAPYPFSSYENWMRSEPHEVSRSELVTGPTYTSFTDYKTSLTDKLRQALEIVSLIPEHVNNLTGLYENLVYEKSPVFCGGDIRTSNILVKGDNLTGLIDWEWSYGGDPASFVASWSSWNNDPQYLDYFLEGYQPSDLLSFRRRVLMYEVVDTVSLILFYKGIESDWGINFAKIKLEKFLNEKLWMR